jgi:hypothetical protein
MNNSIVNSIQKHKQLLVLSVVAIALAAYLFPADSLFTNHATAARGGGSGPYGHFGTPPGHGGQNPGQGGGSPPGNTPGGSNTPPGQQRGD